MKLNKIIFLDVDGVLNIMSDSYRTFMKPYGQHIEPHLISRLNFILKELEKEDFNTSIVISSSWKADMDDLKTQMEEQGFAYWNKVIGRTPFGREMNNVEGINCGLRGLQIKQWLDSQAQEINDYVVIEDEPSDVCGEKCNVIPKEKVIHINMDEGLQHKDCISVLEKLTNKEYNGKKRI